jgi:hypothetical protein
MSNLILSGNTNPHTFANSIVAADGKSEQIFGERLEWIYVLHSSASQVVLGQEIGWVDHLKAHGIARDQLIEKVVEVSDSEPSIRSFLDYLERTLKGLPENARLMVDLTNGTSFQKALLSVATYILDIRHQYVIDIGLLGALTKDRGFLPRDLLLRAYIAAPDSTLLDPVAYLNVSEMTRYRRIVEAQTQRYAAIDPGSADASFFANNLEHSIRLKMQGDRRRVEQTGPRDSVGMDNVIYRTAAASMATSVEDLIRVLIARFIASNPSQYAKQTFGQRLHLIENRVRHDPPPDFDLEFFGLFNEFMLYLRNSTTHKGRLLTNLERFKAELSLKMSFPFIEFYTDIVAPLLKDQPSSAQTTRVVKLSPKEIPPGEVLYFGLDGDDTGSILEDLLMNSGNERACEKHSTSVSAAITQLSSFIRKEPQSGTIIFAAGDDLLFKGRFTEDMLHNLQEHYHRITGNLTCSIGFGRTLQEVYVALKWAKTMPGKNAIVGVKLA